MRSPCLLTKTDDNDDVMTPPFDVDGVREDFPVLSQVFPRRIVSLDAAPDPTALLLPPIIVIPKPSLRSSRPKSSLESRTGRLESRT